jgi:hypothetical protein
MTILKLFNFFKGKRKDDIDFYEYGMTHQEAAIFVLKRSDVPLTAEQIIGCIHEKNLKLRRDIKNVNSFRASLFYLFNKGKIKYQPFKKTWQI